MDAEAIFIPQLLMDLIQRLVERGVLRTDDASELIKSSLAKSADCNPRAADQIAHLSSFYERFAIGSQEAMTCKQNNVDSFLGDIG